MAFTTLGVIILWIGWFSFNPGSTLSVDFGGVGFFAYVALTTNLAAAAGVLGTVLTSWTVVKKPDLSMMLNGAIAALVAITAACAFVAPWAAIVIGFVSGIIVVLGSLLVEKVGIDDPVGAMAAAAEPRRRPWGGRDLARAHAGVRDPLWPIRRGGVVGASLVRLQSPAGRPAAFCGLQQEHAD